MFVSPSDLQSHQNDYDWLDEHIHQVYSQIKHGLEFPPTAIEAIELLNAIMHYVLTRHDYAKWEPLLIEALLHAMELRDVEYQIQIWGYYGHLHFQLGRYKTASGTLRKALQRSTLDATPEMLLMARIGMLRTKTIFETRGIATFIEETLEAAQEIADYHLLGKLHHTLAVAYAHQAETRKALGHGQIALACWYRENNLSERERTFLILAEICRVAMRYEQAARFLERIHPGSENSFISATIRYHRAATRLETGELEAARLDIEYALRQFKSLDFPYLNGSAHHTLGLIQTKLDDFDSARDNLRRALIIWQQGDNVFQQVSCIYALGFLEERAGRFDEARPLYRRGLELSDGLPDSPALTELRAELTQHLKDVQG